MASLAKGSLSTSEKKALLIASPMSGSGDATALITPIIGAIRECLTVHVLKSADAARNLSTTFDLRPFEVIYVASGDTAVQELVAASAESGWPYAPLVLLLVGSSNLTALSLYDRKPAIDIVKSALEPSEIYLYRVRDMNGGGFVNCLNIAGVGDTVKQHIFAERLRWTGLLAQRYMLSFLYHSLILTSPMVDAKIRFDDDDQWHEARMHSLFTSTSEDVSPTMKSGFGVRITDRLFGVTGIKTHKVMALFKMFDAEKPVDSSSFLRKIVTRLELKLSAPLLVNGDAGIEILRTNHLVIESWAKPVPVFKLKSK